MKQLASSIVCLLILVGCGSSPEKAMSAATQALIAAAPKAPVVEPVRAEDPAAPAQSAPVTAPAQSPDAPSDISPKIQLPPNCRFRSGATLERNDFIIRDCGKGNQLVSYDPNGNLVGVYDNLTGTNIQSTVSGAFANNTFDVFVASAVKIPGTNQLTYKVLQLQLSVRPGQNWTSGFIDETTDVQTIFGAQTVYGGRNYGYFFIPINVQFPAGDGNSVTYGDSHSNGHIAYYRGGGWHAY